MSVHSTYSFHSPLSTFRINLMSRKLISFFGSVLSFSKDLNMFLTSTMLIFPQSFSYPFNTFDIWLKNMSKYCGFEKVIEHLRISLSNYMQDSLYSCYSCYSFNFAMHASGCLTAAYLNWNVLKRESLCMRTEEETDKSVSSILLRIVMSVFSTIPVCFLAVFILKEISCWSKDLHNSLLICDLSTYIYSCAN